MKVENSETWLLVGASKGLGFEFFKQIQNLSNIKPTLIFANRNIENLKKEVGPNDQAFSYDMSKPELVEKLIETLNLKKITRFFYFAGGGPYGNFIEKSWKDHDWALNVTFVSVAKLLHYFLQQDSFRQAILIGSDIAENSPDPGASSYSAAKHALRGLVCSLQKEIGITKDLRLFSPGYMNTGLLPKSAWPRTQAGLVTEPVVVAEQLFVWMQDSNFKAQNWSKRDL